MIILQLFISGVMRAFHFMLLRVDHLGGGHQQCIAQPVTGVYVQFAHVRYLRNSQPRAAGLLGTQCHTISSNLPCLASDNIWSISLQTKSRERSTMIRAVARACRHPSASRQWTPA
jgi:hypothetical protein